LQGWRDLIGIASAWLALAAVGMPQALDAMIELLGRWLVQPGSLGQAASWNWLLEHGFVPLLVLPAAGAALGLWSLFLGCSRVNLVTAGVVVNIAEFVATLIVILPVNEQRVWG
jgi:hypothetical protein